MTDIIILFPYWWLSCNKLFSLTDDEVDNDAVADDFDDTHGEALGASFRATPSLDFELRFGAVDSNVDLHHTPLLSPLYPLPPPLASPPPSAVDGEPI